MSTPVPSVRSVRVSLLSGRTVELDAEDQLVLQLLRRAEATDTTWGAPSRKDIRPPAPFTCEELGLV